MGIIYRQMRKWSAIFDMDGVVVETVQMHYQAWKRMFGERGKPFSFEDYKARVDGIPRRDGAKAVLGDLPPAELNRACEQKQAFFLELLEREKVPAYPGTVALVKSIRESGRKTALISSSKNLPRIIGSAGVADLWDAIVNGHDISKGKPDPEIFLMAADRLGVLPTDCVVFEDAVLGVEAAKRAGSKCVGIDRYGDSARLSRADIVVTDLSETSLAQVDALFNA